MPQSPPPRQPRSNPPPDETDRYRQLIRNLRTGAHKKINPLVAEIMGKIGRASRRAENASMKTYVPFNIWDDFWDDGCAPKGEIQKTVGYVEVADEWTEAEKRAASKVVLDFLKTLDMKGVKFGLSGDRIWFEHLTHARLDQLMDELKASDLRYKGMPFKFYSES